MSEEIQRLLGGLIARVQNLEDDMKSVNSRIGKIWAVAFSVGMGAVGIIVAYLLKQAGLY